MQGQLNRGEPGRAGHDRAGAKAIDVQHAGRIGYSRRGRWRALADRDTTVPPDDRVAYRQLPFGTIAGIQYKHASVAAFEGYAGPSRLGFRAEVNNEHSLGQLDDLLIYFDERLAEATLSGLAAARISAPLTALCQPTRCPNACITSKHRPGWAWAAKEAKSFEREALVAAASGA